MNIQVLLSTYNGEKYISDQLSSILQQKFTSDVKLFVLIRDDGSSDKTVEIIKDIQKQTDITIELFCGENIGWRNSFCELVKMAGEFDFYAFSDQDDIWFENKLDIAINKLITQNKVPALYCGPACMVDMNMSIIGNTKVPYSNSLTDSLIKCKVLGCTEVFNAELYKYLLLSVPKDIPHDWWVFNVCMAVSGIIIFDNNPYIFYRQHSDNASGYLTNMACRYKKLFNNKEHNRERMAKSLLVYYQEEKKSFVYDMASYRSDIRAWIRIVLGWKYYRKINAIETIFIKIYTFLRRA